LIYSGVFWGGLASFCASLLIYNLIKMFKLDEDIQNLFNDFVEWFATPPTSSEKELMEEMVKDTGDNEDEMFGPEG
jgi:hypothetical protein